MSTSSVVINIDILARLLNWEEYNLKYEDAKNTKNSCPT